MAFHLTVAGNYEPCTASARSCPLALVEEHFATVKEAARERALRNLEDMTDFVVVPPDFKEFDDAPPPRELPVAPAERSASSLSVSDLIAFQRSAANRPKQVREDWREVIARNAEVNGDAFADANPDRSLVNAYYDASVDEE